MARFAFFSFHYKPDSWRASQVRNMGVVDGNKAANDNDWETVTKGGDQKIKDWIQEQMKGRSCTVVLIGTNTAGRKWIDYEIVESWKKDMGILGVYIHNLKDKSENQATRGNNPFEGFTIEKTVNGQIVKIKLSDIVKCYYPPHTDSKEVYAYIKNNLATWLEESIKIRNQY